MTFLTDLIQFLPILPNFCVFLANSCARTLFFEKKNRGVTPLHGAIPAYDVCPIQYLSSTFIPLHPNPPTGTPRKSAPWYSLLTLQ